MDTYADNKAEKEFLGVVNEMIRELNESNAFGEETLLRMQNVYRQMSEEKREKCLNLLYDVLREDYGVAIYLMSAVLRKTKDKTPIAFIVKLMLDTSFPLWERWNDFYQFKIFLFTNCSFGEYELYRDRKRIYESFLEEIKSKLPSCRPAIPFGERRKKVIVVTFQMINQYHAPTVTVRHIFQCLEQMGYDAECFVCYLRGMDGSWDWSRAYYGENFIQQTAPFEWDMDGVNIKGYNLRLQGSDYVDTLRRAVDLIWESKPEYVLEVGSETVLAGLCKEFTTVVGMGMTRNLPVTNAQIIACLSEASREERGMWKDLLDADQSVAFFKMAVHALEEKTAGTLYQRKDFGMPEDAFVIVIAGNRLDNEINEPFERILFQMLDRQEHAVVEVIGECPEFRERILRGTYAGRFYFLGHQKDFKSAIGMGDLFLNPPRQGGGTGGLFAIMEEIPVVTLGDCDVAETAGKEFVCKSMEEMPGLVFRYESDAAFMNIQKENCRKEALKKTDIDNIREFWKLHDAVAKYNAREERG